MEKTSQINQAGQNLIGEQTDLQGMLRELVSSKLAESKLKSPEALPETPVNDMVTIAQQHFANASNYVSMLV